MRDHHRRIVDWLAKQGATEIRLEPRKHTHIHFVWHGAAMRYVTSSTTSDTIRASHNAIGDLRHMLGLTEDVKRIGARRKPRERAAAVRTHAPSLSAGADWRQALPNLWPNRGQSFLRKLVAGFARYDAVVS